MTTLAPLCACGTVSMPQPKSQRIDDAQTLRLQHMRLWTTGGYPLWLEVRTPRNAEPSEREVTLVFTTTISAHPRLERCEMATLRSEGESAEITDVRYARTAMQVDTDVPTLHQHHRERGIVEDVYVSIPATRLLQLTARDKLSGDLCKLGIHFNSIQRQQIRELVEDAQRVSRAASSRASTMLSSMEQ